MKTLLHFLAPLIFCISLAPAENVISYSHDPGELVSFPKKENDDSSESDEPTYVNISLPTLQDQADGSPEEILSRLNSQIENNGYIPIEQRYPDIHFAVKDEDMEEGKMYIDSSEQHTVARMKITNSSPADETGASSKYAALTHCDMFMEWIRGKNGAVDFNYYLKKVWVTYEVYSRKTRAHEERHVIDNVGTVRGIKFPPSSDNLEDEKGKVNGAVYWDKTTKGLGASALSLPQEWYDNSPRSEKADNESNNILNNAVKEVFAAKGKVKTILEARAQYAEVYYELQVEKKNNKKLFSRDVRLIAPSAQKDINIMNKYVEEIVNKDDSIQFISTIKKDNKEKRITMDVGITYGKAFEDYFLNEKGEIDRNKVQSVNKKLNDAKKELVEKLKKFGIAYLNAFDKDIVSIGTDVDRVKDWINKIYVDYTNAVINEKKMELKDAETLSKYMKKREDALDEIRSQVNIMGETDRKIVKEHLLSVNAKNTGSEKFIIAQCGFFLLNPNDFGRFRAKFQQLCNMLDITDSDAIMILKQDQCQLPAK